jgi:hypothetical protein
VHATQVSVWPGTPRATKEFETSLMRARHARALSLVFTEGLLPLQQDFSIVMKHAAIAPAGVKPIPKAEAGVVATTEAFRGWLTTSCALLCGWLQ